MKFETNKEFMENLSLHCLRASTIFLHASGSLKFFMITKLNLLSIFDPIQSLAQPYDK